jgi:microsomal dipeptidase-like Zn-dependent dipeptidase
MGAASRWRRRLAVSTLAAGGLVLPTPVLRAAVGERLVARTERRLCTVADPGPYPLPPAAADLHERLAVVDLHADSLLWGRDLLVRGDRGHVDVPRLVEGNVALQVFAATTHVPRDLNYDANDDRTDDVRLLAIAQGWPRATWTSRVARAEELARRLHATADRSDGHLVVVRTASDIDRILDGRTPERHDVVGGLLAVEGAHALDDDLANVERLDQAGYRMVGLVHFFDNAFGGSAHGVARGGLTPLGRDLVAELERRQILVDVAHASSDTIDDVLAIARRPVVASHTGVRGVADHPRNLTDDHLRAIAATGGLAGIGFWPTAAGGEGAEWIARSIAHAVAVMGAEHVARGSDFDGAVGVPFDASGMGVLTAALLGQGLDESTIAAVMGGNAIRLLRGTLPVG